MITDYTPNETENLVTYTYDDYDRLLYRNVYRGVASFRVGQIDPGWTKKPKKLLYQDVYTYEGMKRINPSIKRVYQPVLDFVSLIRDGSSGHFVTAIGNFTCRSPILVSGFIWSINSNLLLNIATKPKNFLKENPIASNVGSASGFQKFLNPSTFGQKIYTFENASTVYVKMFAQIETGTLFSKTLSV